MWQKWKTRIKESEYVKLLILVIGMVVSILLGGWLLQELPKLAIPIIIYLAGCIMGITIRRNRKEEDKRKK